MGIIMHVHMCPSPYTFAGAVAYRHATYGRGSIGQPIHLNYVNCYGYELRLTQCQYSRQTSACSHYNDAGVYCQRGKHCNHIVYPSRVPVYLALSHTNPHIY